MTNSRFPFRLSEAPNENIKVLKVMLSPAAFPDRLVAKASLRIICSGVLAENVSCRKF